MVKAGVVAQLCKMPRMLVKKKKTDSTGTGSLVTSQVVKKVEMTSRGVVISSLGKITTKLAVSLAITWRLVMLKKRANRVVNRPSVAVVNQAISIVVVPKPLTVVVNKAISTVAELIAKVEILVSAISVRITQPRRNSRSHNSPPTSKNLELVDSRALVDLPVASPVAAPTGEYELKILKI